MALERREEVSAGGVVYRRGREGVEVLLGDQRDWRTREQTVRLPKGHLDPGETEAEAARREVREETGREAEIEGPLGEVRYEYRVPADEDGNPEVVIDKRVVFFLMRDAGPAADARDEEMQRVYWASLDAAKQALSFPAERDVMARAAELLGA